MNCPASVEKFPLGERSRVVIRSENQGRSNYLQCVESVFCRHCDMGVMCLIWLCVQGGLCKTDPVAVVG